MKKHIKIKNLYLRLSSLLLVLFFVTSANASGNACPTNAVTTLNQASVTNLSPANGGTLTVTSTFSFPASGPYVILIDSEQMLVTTTNATTLTLNSTSGRAFNGTTTAAHTNGVSILLVSCNASTTINSTISKVITAASTSGTVDLSVYPTASGVQTIASDTVSVSTNDSSGYSLMIAMDSSKANSNLVSGANNIPTSSGSQTTPTTQSSNTWGYCVSGIGGFGSSCPSASTSNAAISGTYKFAGVPLYSSPNKIKTTATTATNDTTTVWYAAAANINQASGLYTSQVTYTAIAN